MGLRCTLQPWRFVLHRAHFQFSMLSLILCVTFLAIASAIVREIHVRRVNSAEAAARLESRHFVMRRESNTIASLSQVKNREHREPLTSQDLGDISQLHDLTSLELTDIPIGADIGHLLDGQTKLRRLSLEGDFIDSKDLNVLRKMSQIEELRISGKHITDSIGEHIEHLTRIRVLEIAGGRFSDEGLARLARLEQLTDLTIACAEWSGGLTCLSGHGQLVSLTVRLPRMKDNAWQSVVVGCPRLQWLSVESPVLNAGDVEDLCRAEWLRGLYCSIRPEALCRLHDIRRLEVLSVSCGQLHPTDLDCLGQCDKLRCLQIMGTPLFAGHADWLRNLGYIEGLYVSWAFMHENILKALKLSNCLTKVGIIHGRYTSDQLAAVQNSLPNVDVIRVGPRSLRQLRRLFESQ
jgi:hypothetical protein